MGETAVARQRLHPKTGELPDEIGRGVRTRGEHEEPWVKVPRASLDALYSLRVWGTWRGEKIQLTDGRDGELGFAYLGSSAFAREQGMVGDQQAGYVGTSPANEVQDLREERTELHHERRTEPAQVVAQRAADQDQRRQREQIGVNHPASLGVPRATS